jgi:hypothetical protein
MAIAIVDHGHSSPRVVALAAAGELEDATGQKLAPFVIANASSARGEVRKLRRRRAEQGAARAGARTPEDRLRAVVEAELAFIERQPAGRRNVQRLGALVKLAQELRRDAGPSAPPRAMSGVSDTTQAAGLGGTLLDAHRRDPRRDPLVPVVDVAASIGHEREAAEETERAAAYAAEHPGAWARQQLAQLIAEQEEPPLLVYSSGPPTSGGEMRSRRDTEVDYTKLPDEDVGAIIGAEQGRRQRMRSI